MLRVSDFKRKASSFTRKASDFTRKADRFIVLYTTAWYGAKND